MVSRAHIWAQGGSFACVAHEDAVLKGTVEEDTR
jgi:hypothetical protein